MSDNSMNFNYEFNYKAITNGSSQTSKTNEVKESGELPNGNKFDYDKLNALFLNEGLDALLEELRKLEEENIIQNLKTETNKVSCTYQDIEYTFETPSAQNKPAVSTEPIDDTPTTDPEQGTVPQGNGINYNRYKISYKYNSYDYKSDIPDDSYAGIKPKELYDLILNGKMREAMIMLVEAGYYIEQSTIKTSDGEIPVFTANYSGAVTFKIAYDTNYSNEIPYPTSEIKNTLTESDIQSPTYDTNIYCRKYELTVNGQTYTFDNLDELYEINSYWADNLKNIFNGQIHESTYTQKNLVETQRETIDGLISEFEWTDSITGVTLKLNYNEFSEVAFDRSAMALSAFENILTKHQHNIMGSQLGLDDYIYDGASGGDCKTANKMSTTWLNNYGYNGNMDTAERLGIKAEGSTLYSYNLEDYRGLCEKFLNRNPNEIGYLNYDGSHDVTLFDVAFLDACGVKMGDSVESAMEKVYNTIKNLFTSVTTNGNSRMWYSVDNAILLEFIMGNNAAGINYFDVEIQEHENLRIKEYQRKTTLANASYETCGFWEFHHEFVGPNPTDYSPEECYFDFSRYGMYIEGRHTPDAAYGNHMAYTDIPTDEANLEAEKVVYQALALVRQGKIATAMKMLEDAGARYVGETWCGSPWGEDTLLTDYTAPHISFELNGFFYHFNVDNAGFAAWEDYTCDIAREKYPQEYYDLPIGDRMTQHNAYEAKYPIGPIGNSDEIDTSQIEGYEDIKPVLDMIRQGKVEEAMRILTKIGAKAYMNVTARNSDMAKYYIFDIKYKDYSYVIKTDEWGWQKDPSSTPNCNAYGQALYGVPAEFRSTTPVTGAVKAFGESFVETTAPKGNAEAGINSSDGITDNSANWRNYAVLAGEKVTYDANQIEPLYEEFKNEALEAFRKNQGKNLPYDENGNVVILGNEFKEYVKSMLKTEIEAIMKYYYKAQEHDELRPGTAWDVWFSSSVRSILAALGFEELPFAQEYALDSCSKLQAYIDDDSKLEAHLKNLCAKLGSTDGKTVSLENYYFNLADTDAYFKLTSADEDPLDSKKELMEKARLTLYVEDLKQKYPDIYNQYGEFIISCYKDNHWTGAAGQYRGDHYYDQIRDTYNCTGTPNDELAKVLKIAAGVTSADSYKERGEKLAALFNKIGVDAGQNGKYNNLLYSMDVVSLFNYLIGENPSRINFIATQQVAFENSLENPVYKVGTAKELQKVMLTNPFANIELTADIDLAEVNWQTIPVFYGKIDGYWVDEHTSIHGYHIKNINATNGFIAFADGANFGHTHFENVLSSDGKDLLVLQAYDNIIGGYLEPDKIRPSDGAVYCSDEQAKLMKGDGSYKPANIIERSTENTLEVGTLKPNEKTNTRPTGGTPSRILIVSAGNASTNSQVYGIEAEMNEYLKSLLADIAVKYYSHYGSITKDTIGHEYELLDGFWSDYNKDPDDPEYWHVRCKWINQEDKENCYKETEAAIKKFIEKYGEHLSSVIYDGQTVQYVTKYSDTIYTPPLISPQLNVRGEITYDKAGKLYLPVEGDIAQYAEPTIDKPIIYTPLEVFRTNIPDGIPYDGDKPVVATKLDGIFVSNDGSIYIWNQRQEEYIKTEIKYSTQLGPAALWAGNYDALPFGESMDLDALLLNVVFEYNMTSNDQIFEKDGKFYVIDGRLRYSHGGLQGLREILVESEMNDQSMVVYHDGSNGNTASTPAAPTTPADDVTGSGSANAPAATAPPAADDDYGMDLDEDDGDNDVIDGKLTETDYDTSANDYWEDVLEELEDDEDDDTIDDTVDETVEEEVQPEQTSYAPKADAFRPPVLYTAETLTKTMRRAARNNGMRATGTKGVYRLGSKRYIWDPQSGCFRRYNKSTGTQFIRAITLAYENGFNVTEDYPWTCELNGVYYTFDQIQGIYVPSVN